MADDPQLVFLKEVIDFVLPALPPYEFCVYLLLLRRSHLQTGSPRLQIGKRTLADLFGQGTRSRKPNYQQVSGVLKGLEEKGYISVGETTREGTVYIVKLPREISALRSILVPEEVITERDYFVDPEGRKEIFERDNWICQYCGDRLHSETATLDHFVPQCEGGRSTKENLRASCLTCNSIKAGKSYEAAAPLLLDSIRVRRAKAANA